MDGFYRRSPRVASRVIDGEAVLVKMPESMLYLLNTSAARIWTRADGIRRGAELAEELPPSAAGSFLESMTELGLLERSSSPREAAEPFPQGIEPRPSSELPVIRVSEAVEILAAGTCNQFGLPLCAVPVNP